MARITRKTLVQFASSAVAAALGIGQYGSAAETVPAYSTDPSVIQSLAAWLGGWANATLGGSKFPALEDMNAVQFVHSYMQAYSFQEGIPEWDNGTTYYQNSIVKNPGTMQLYGSVTNGNVGNAVTDPTNWQFLIDLASVSSNLYTGGVSTGAANAQVIAAVTPSSGFGLRNGVTVTATAGFTNTGATTLNIQGTGVLNFQKESGGALVNLAAGDLTVSQLFTAQYNSTANVWVLTGVVPANYLQVSNNLSDLGSIPTALTNLGFTNGIGSGTSGYYKLPGGLIMQWGPFTAYTPVTYPVTFPTRKVSLQFNGNANGTQNSSGWVGGDVTETTSGFTPQMANLGAAWTGTYLALGY